LSSSQTFCLLCLCCGASKGQRGSDKNASIWRFIVVARDGCRFPPLLGFLKHTEEKRKSILQTEREFELQALLTNLVRAIAAEILEPLGTRSKTLPRWNDEKSSRSSEESLESCAASLVVVVLFITLLEPVMSEGADDENKAGEFSGARFSQFPLRPG